MDPLSDVLALLKPRSYISRGFEIPPRIAIRWPQHEGIKCYAIISGECWLSVEGCPGPLHLRVGDCILLPPGPPFCLTTDLAVAALDFEMLRASWDANLPHAREPGSCSLFGGHFLLTGENADLLLRSLPPIVHLRSEGDKAAMRWSLERMRDEMHNPQPGSSLISQQLAYMMLVQALRLHLTASERGTGWLFALADKQMSAAITCMHNSPGDPWTLQALADHVGMSRSVFASRFKSIVGLTPMDYLTRWRMMLAGDRLQHANSSLGEIAAALGYDSESAFGKAFRRTMGCSPRQYSRHGGVTPGPPAIAQDFAPIQLASGAEPSVP